MNFFRKLFGAKPRSGPAAETSSPLPHPAAPVSTDSSAAPAPIRAHDAYGRELQISKEEWRTKILPDQLARLRDQPDALAACILQSLQDGFAADLLEAAAHLAATDSEAERGHVLHALTLLEVGRHEEAEAVLLRFIDRHGATGVALTNLAKTQAARGDREAARDTLWRGLTLAPNQDNAVAWFEALHREQHGPAAGLDALRRLAELPDSWRARLWLARHELAQRQLPAAIRLYDEALDRAPRPVPADLLQQMSGDLGNFAHLPELLQLTAPYYDLATHGLPVGVNLLKAYHDLGQLDLARRLLNRLYSQNRPDWKAQLAFWETELAKTGLATSEPPKPEKIEVTLLAVEGPVWLPPDSPAAELFPAKSEDAALVAFLGSSAEVDPASAEPGRARLSDAPGRLSRALPLYLTERLEFQSGALGRTLVPWIVKPRPGFILGGMPWDDATASRHARAAVPEDAADYLVITHLRCRAEPWTIEVRVLRTIDAACLATASIPCSLSDLAPALSALEAAVSGALATHAEIVPAPVPAADLLPAPSADYLLRLEQLLAVRTSGIEPGKAPLNGEREILDGQLHLCLEHADKIAVRLLFAHTLKAMKRVRPDILPEFQARADLLQREKPLAEPAHSVVSRLLAEAFAA